MSEGSLWDLFKDTGDPLCWLYCRAAEKNKEIEPKSSEDKPQALG